MGFLLVNLGPDFVAALAVTANPNVGKNGFHGQYYMFMLKQMKNLRPCQQAIKNGFVMLLDLVLELLENCATNVTKLL